MTHSSDNGIARPQRATLLARLSGGPFQALRRLGGAVRPYVELTAFVVFCSAVAIAASTVSDWMGWAP